MPQFGFPALVLVQSRVVWLGVECLVPEEEGNGEKGQGESCEEEDHFAPNVKGLIQYSQEAHSY